jgi:hypothetical protein
MTVGLGDLIIEPSLKGKLVLTLSLILTLRFILKHKIRFVKRILDEFNRSHRYFLGKGTPAHWQCTWPQRSNETEKQEETEKGRFPELET